MAGFPVSDLGRALGEWIGDQNDYREAKIAERKAAGVEPSEGPIDWDAIFYDLNAPVRERGVEFEGPVDWGGIGNAITGAFGGIGDAIMGPAPRAVETPRVLQDIKSNNGGLIERETFRNPATGLTYDPVTNSYYSDGYVPDRLAPSYGLPEQTRTAEIAAERAALPINMVQTVPVPGGINVVAPTAEVPFPRERPYHIPARPEYAMPPSTSAPQAELISDPGKMVWEKPEFGVPTYRELPGNPPVETNPVREQNIGQKAVDVAGGVLEKTLLGGAVKHFFPDTWYGAGGAIKDVLGGGGGSLAAVEDGYDRWGDPTSPRNSLSPTTGGDGGANGLQGFIDMNGNGIDDRLEGGGFPPTTPQPAAPQISYLEAFFPQMPPYRPGVDAEWQYFRPRGYAEGGIVEAVAASPNGTHPLGGLDPRITIIADAEDALEGEHPDPDTAIAVFIEAFGPDALEMLKAQVQSGMTLRGNQRKSPRMAKSRFVEGPGGPKDDQVPARIDDVEEARLSDGEFVVEADAVRGAGEGDPVKGAAKLSQLADMLAGRNGDDELNVERVR